MSNAITAAYKNADCGLAFMEPMVHPQTQPHLLTEDKEQDEGYYFWMQPAHSVKLTKMQQYNKTHR